MSKKLEGGWQTGRAWSDAVICTVCSGLSVPYLGLLRYRSVQGLPCLLFTWQFFNLYHSVLIQQMILFFFIFHRQQDLTFHANCLHWRQFAWNLKSWTGFDISCTMSSLWYFSYFPQKTGFDIPCKLSPICMKCQNLFSGENKKNIPIHRLLKILPRVLSINTITAPIVKWPWYETKVELVRRGFFVVFFLHKNS